MKKYIFPIVNLILNCAMIFILCKRDGSSLIVPIAYSAIFLVATFWIIVFLKSGKDIFRAKMLSWFMTVFFAVFASFLLFEAIKGCAPTYEQCDQLVLISIVAVVAVGIVTGFVKSLIKRK